ncbi:MULTISPECIES: patatin-like phospholipase family protein [unclassified Nocardia]|uniref:patatin-like phospholipase family protein n=1 Tax=unclassified Nocardia TaxID=2637762 RepID=UPI00278BEDBC|nr:MULTISPECIES: patatin-like phospholipase family protein [unclassified Nocardia]
MTTTRRETNNISQGTVAFVLSGGAAHGAIQAGMLTALYENDIAPDLITAASAGALNAAFIASRPATPETAADLARIWLALRRADVFPLNPVTGFLGFSGRRNSFVSPHGLREVVSRSLEFQRLEDAPIPLSVVATDLLTGAEQRLDTGPAVDALLASAAIPGVFPPVRWGDRLLVDGGVAAHTPIADAIDRGARTIYVLATGYSCALHRPPRGPLGIATHALSMLIQHQVAADIARVPEYVRLIVLPPPCPLDIPSTDFSHAAELIDRARADALAFLPYLDHRRVPASMRHPVHEH